MTAQTPATPEISLVEAVWRYRLMSFLIVLVSVLAAVGATMVLFSSAQATARFAVTDPTNTNNVLRNGVVSGQGYATYTAQRAAFAGSSPVLARAAEILPQKGGPALSAGALRGRVQTSSKPDGGVVIVVASGEDMHQAALVANAVVQAYQEVTIKTNQQQLDKQLSTLQATRQKLTGQLDQAVPGTREYRALTADLSELQERMTGVVSARSNTTDGVQFVDNADPSAATPSKVPRNAAIGAALGLILACVVSFLRAAGQMRRQAMAQVAGGPGYGPPGYDPRYGPGYGPPGLPRSGYGPPFGDQYGESYRELPHGEPAPYEGDYRVEVDAPYARAELPRPAAPPRRPPAGERPRGERGGHRRAAREVPPPAATPSPPPAAAPSPPSVGTPGPPPPMPPAPASPPPPSTEDLLDRAEALLERPEPTPRTASSSNGSLGAPVAGNGAPSRGKPSGSKGTGSKRGTSKPSGSSSGSRSKGGAHSKGAHAKDASAGEQAATPEVPSELWNDGIGLSGDPTRTIEDNPIIVGKDAASILKEVSEEAEKGKNNGSSSLMRYDK
jgi:capsular polysaccharide biosynthesis protein